jgi:tRNA-N(6)-(isopentenyl)adenosine-37 thiotransferase enzyme MiaB
MTINKENFYIETFGCQMNEFDSERISAILEREGYLKTGQQENAGLIVLNTCSVRLKAEDRLFGHIGNLKALKVKNPGLIICIGGCTAQSLKEKLTDTFPYIDIVFGTGNIEKLPQLIKAKALSAKSICETSENQEEIKELVDFKRSFPFKAFIPVIIGCDNYCSYCIVPYVRGHETSIKPAIVIDSIKKLAADGVCEVMLLGQNVNSYGHDFNQCGAADTVENINSFSKLLNAIAVIEGIKRIRFMTSHPKDLTEDIINAINDNSNIMGHIHLPLQAGSDKILKKMNRKYTSKEYGELFYKIKEKIPHCAVTTDIIVGFPGEEEEDFSKTLELVKTLRFNRAFTFIYSSRRGTAAETFDDPVPIVEKKKWFKQLLDTQNNISLAENTKMTGKIFKALVESESTKKIGQLEGRLENNTIVNFEGPNRLIGRFIDLEISQAHSFYLSGKTI